MIGVLAVRIENLSPCSDDDRNRRTFADGSADPDDLADFISCYFAQPDCSTADFSGDGTIDPDDLADFISAFFAGCD